MSQTILAQILGYYDSETSRQAVKLAHLTDTIEELQRELALALSKNREMQCDRESLLRDLDQLKRAQEAYGKEHVITHLENLGMAERTERYSVESRLAAAKRLLEQWNVIAADWRERGLGWYPELREETRAFLEPEPAAKAS